MKVKIKKPVLIGGKLHHKVGAVVEVGNKHGRTLVEDGWAETVTEDAPVDPGATIDPSKTAGKPAGQE